MATAMTKHQRIATESLTFLAIVGGILVLLNILGIFFFQRVDLTKNRLFSLSDGSKNLSANLKDKMEITAYFTSDLPPPFNATERYVRDLLSEYQAVSKGNIRVKMVNPNNDERRQAAERDGVRPMSHQVIENDAVSVKEGYRGIVFRYLGDSKVIPAVQDTAGLEYRITQLIKEMVGEKLAIGVVSGHDGPSLSQGLSAVREALPNYDLREVSLNGEVPSELRTLLIVGPEKPFTDEELRHLDAYIMKGGSLGVFGGGVKIKLDGEQPTAEAEDVGLNKLLSKWGIRINSNIVADDQCARVPMRGPFGLQVAVPHPPVPVVGFNEEQQEHPALFRIPSTAFPFTSSLSTTDTLKGDRGVKVTVLGQSSKNAWLMEGETIPLGPRHPREWQPSEKIGQFPLAIAVEGKLPSAFGAGAMSSAEAKPSSGPDRAAKDVRILVVGASFLLRDEFMPREQAGGERDLNSALAFALNSVDWLSQDSDLIAIRAKNIEDPALEIPSAVQNAEKDAMQAESSARDAIQQGDEQTARGKIDERNSALEKRKAALAAWDVKKATYRYLNTIGVPIAFALFGLVRWRQRSAKKKTLSL